MIRGLTGLIVFQLAGELVVQLTGLPVPGPVVGMLFLFVWLQWRDPGEDTALVRAGSGLLRHLQLLFVPAGVGITAYLGELADSWLPILVAMLGSWLIALAGVGWTAVALERLLGRPRDDYAGEGA
ncbi:CidA/LrgA family protein [Nocardioides panacisoli]|uniref:CidA/LrgA family protein n=1 Tax=Nocardioides panacisoli TaxID=627624 RepID=UPI001C629CD4|nr:CidA/LrgA family protein [Nocardioides panacisoli]QYJ03828.1 CidA/LrgA family protein [Nocardioides panacisoli]